MTDAHEANLGRYIYLASPYSDPRPSTRIRRMRRALTAAADLTKAGHKVFAPIPVGYLLEERLGEQPHAFWIEWCLTFLPHASHLYVLTLPGWEESKGLGIEVRRAAALGIPIVGCNILTECEDVSGFNIRGWFQAEELTPDGGE